MDIDAMTSMRKGMVRLNILRILDSAKAAGGMRGRAIMAIFDNEQERPEDEQELAGMLVDLVNRNYVIEQDIRRSKHERRDLASLKYSITGWGTALLEKRIDPDPLVYDDRLTPPQHP